MSIFKLQHKLKFEYYLLLFTELSLQSLDTEPIDPERQMDVQYYEDDHGNLIPIMAARIRLVKDSRELFYVGLQIGTRVYPIFDRDGWMIRVRIEDYRNFGFPTALAREYRFKNPQRRRVVPEAWGQSP